MLRILLGMLLGIIGIMFRVMLGIILVILFGIILGITWNHVGNLTWNRVGNTALSGALCVFWMQRGSADEEDSGPPGFFFSYHKYTFSCLSAGF